MEVVIEQKFKFLFTIIYKMIKSVIARQKDELRGILNQRLIERESKRVIKKFMDKDIVKIITGIRRSGKSVLSLLLLKDREFGYVNFDEKLLVEGNPEKVLSAVKEIYGDIKILLLDEIQNLDGWELWVNSLYRRNYNLIITGSNAKLLSRELSTHLTGRYLEFEVSPFSFREYLRWKNFDLENLEYIEEKQGRLKHELREYLLKGGFPELVVKELDENYLRTLFDAIIYKDVVRRWNVRYPRKIEDLSRYLLGNASTLYTFTKLRKILDFRSTLTVENYVSYIEEAYLIFSLERFSFKLKERLKAPRKCYAIDTGLINAITSRFTEESGRVMENLVFIELKRKGLKENRNIFYYRDYRGREVDFVVKEGLKIKQLIQVCYDIEDFTTKERELKALVKAGKELKCKNLKVITWDYEGEEEFKNRKVEFTPLWKWLLGI